MAEQSIVLLPGLGADERLFIAQRDRFPTLHVPRWIDPLPKETLRDYAKRMAAAIPPSDNLILGGVSMGGMVAQEIAKILKPRGLILIATCQSPAEIAPWISKVVAIEKLTPAFLGDYMRRFAELGMPAMGVYEPAHKAIILDIAADTSINFVRWAAGAILSWPGVLTTPSPSFPILRIHGRRDRMILCPASSNILHQTTVLVPGAGHVLNLTHSQQVNDAISSWLPTLNQGG